MEVFSELHTICQFDKDSKPYLPLILEGIRFSQHNQTEHIACLQRILMQAEGI